LNFLLLDT